MIIFIFLLIKDIFLPKCQKIKIAIVAHSFEEVGDSCIIRSNNNNNKIIWRWPLPMRVDDIISFKHELR
jgi:hypothetical protein